MSNPLPDVGSGAVAAQSPSHGGEASLVDATSDTLVESLLDRTESLAVTAYPESEAVASHETGPTE